MMLEEAQSLLKKTTITQYDLWALNSLYLLLDLEKEDFCKIVDEVGFEKLVAKQDWYDRIYKAEEDLTARERVRAARIRLAEIETEGELLKEVVRSYHEYN